MIVDFSFKFRRRLLVRIRRAGPVSWTVCRGCGVSSDVTYGDVEDLSVASIRHGQQCPVKVELWRGLIVGRLDENGKPRRRRRRTAA